MKTLFILRHAKSSWENRDLADFERSLNSDGLSAATFMGHLIYKNKIQPNLILSSPAKRAKQTAVLVKETGQIEAKIKYEERIYEASPYTLLQILSELEEKEETVLLVGHNPGLEGLIKILTGELHAMPAGGLAKIDLQIENWSEAGSNSGHLEFLLRPKDEMKALSAE